MENSEYIDLAEAARLSPGKPHTSTVWRWCRQGIKTRLGDQVTLKHIKAGFIYTSKAWLKDFFERIAEADREYYEELRQHRLPTPANAQQRQRSIERAEAVLRAARIVE